MDALTYAIKSLFAAPKMTAFFSVVSAIFAYLFQVASYEVLVIIMALMLLDTITGITASWTEGKEITSRRGFGLIVKSVFYFGSIILISLIKHSVAIHDVSLTPTVDLLQGGMTWWIVGLEVKSNLENLGRLNGGIPDWIRRRILSIFNTPDKSEQEAFIQKTERK